MRALKALLPTSLLLLVLAAPAQGATFTVNTLSDGGDNTSADGLCVTSGGDCTFRAAVEQADAASTPDEIVLGPGVHSLTSSVSVSNNDVTIRGAGAGATTIHQTTTGERVLAVSNSTSVIRDLALTGGSPTFAGGGVYADVSGANSVLMERVLIADNEVFGGAGASPYGGGVVKTGPGLLTIRSSTVSDNRVATIDPTVAVTAYGGGIAHLDGPLNVVNTTIVNNEAEGLGPSAAAFGGGINVDGGATALSNVTLAGNTASGNSGNGGNLASNFSGHLNVENSIVAYGTALASGGGCHVSSGGTLTSSGRNIDTGSSCAFVAPHLSNTDPLLLPPGSNGGPTPTLLPAAASPAINAAIGCPTPATDQRGVARPQGAACDIGAVELVPASGGGEPPPAPDLVPPIVSDFSISARRFRTARATRRTRSLPRATNLVFHLSEPALVDFRFQRRLAGRRGRNGICQRPARRNRGRRRCVRWVAAGSLADNLLEGTQSMHFNGNVTRGGRGRTLGAGSYRVRIEATDPAGHSSAPAGGRFRVVR
jgi:hypothetical protein